LSNVSAADPGQSLAAAAIKSFVCPADQFAENPFLLEAKPGPGQNQTTNPIAGYYHGTSYAGVFGARNYFPRYMVGGESGGMLFGTGPGSWPQPSFKNVAVRIEDVKDGTTNTYFVGEKYHRDPNYDLIGTGGALIHQWSAWGWMGGDKGYAHVFGSASVPINYKTPAGAKGIAFHDERMNAFGSGHTGGANFVLVDGSVRFVRDNISMLAYGQFCNRADGKVSSPE
jgi:prepilin-type processing-associated H-X9-DG protein